LIVFQFARRVLGAQEMVAQLHSVHQVSIVKMEHDSNMNILVLRALFRLQERPANPIVLVARVETTVEKVDFRM